ncbi:hypothetical protein AJ80_01599 [Polytolypa hystricis UAMH7299]|uniref:Deoxyribonuclease NucA/NucB domain-containing protein n=1 Tax=Polytolypa hystricis (strain UAMH7299) TaxID=1447883 RepID=A0A2B7Z0A0_POLH7|nr:hypothetical protein AJ80_01599 [Polytolypa hystricis UAMH7299]
MLLLANVQQGCPKGSQCSAQNGYCVQAGLTKSGSKPSQTKPATKKPTNTKSTKSTKSTKKPTLSISIPDESTTENPPTKTTPPPITKPTESDKPPGTTKPTGTKSTRETDPPGSTKPPNTSDPLATSKPSESSDRSTTEPTKTQNPSSSTASSTGSSTATPTIIFHWVAEFTDDLVENMCLGLRRRAAPVNGELLTYAGPRSRLRKQTQCRNGDCCRGQTKASGPNKGWPLSCDEYPFSSAQEGGRGAHVGCIVAFQNGAQGDYLGELYREYGLKRGDKFMVKITGIDCDTVHEDDIPKCNRFGKRDVLTDSKGIFYPPDTGSNNGRMILALGDLNAGPYHVVMNFPEGSEVTKVAVINNQGYEYTGSAKLVSGSTYILSFNLPDVTYGTSVVADTIASNITAASWKLEPRPAPNGTATSSPTRNTTALGGTTTITTVISGTTVTTTYCPESDTTTTVTKSKTTVTAVVKGTTTVITTYCPETEKPPVPPGHTPAPPEEYPEYPPPDEGFNPPTSPIIPPDTEQPPPNETTSPPDEEPEAPESPVPAPPEEEEPETSEPPASQPPGEQTTAPEAPPSSPPNEQPDAPVRPAATPPQDSTDRPTLTMPSIVLQTTNSSNFLGVNRYLAGVVCALAALLMI